MDDSSTMPPSSSTVDSAGAPPVPKKDKADPIPMVQAANAALMERTAFAIDNAEGDDEDDDFLGDDDDVGGDENVMDEVRDLAIQIFRF